MRLELRSDDRVYQLDVKADGDDYTVALDGDTLDLQVLAAVPGELDICVSGRRIKAYAASRGDERFVFLEGRIFTFRLPDDDESADDAGDSGPNITSRMPGTVVKLLVEPGQSVAVGDGLLIMESMKMEAEITAPVAGEVTAIHVTVGQTVGMSEPLIDLTPAATDTGSRGD